MLELNKKVLLFGKAIEAVFTSSEWMEVGYLTDTADWIKGHARLLRSLSWGDPDYKEHVFSAVKVILAKDPENLRKVLEYEPIASYIQQKDPRSYKHLREEVYGNGGAEDVEHVEPATSTEAGLAALADAQELLRTRGALSAVDRVHTGLHAFLRAACDQADITYSRDTTANQLLKLVLDQHPKLQDFGARSDDVRRILRTSGSIVDSLGTLRNQASLAHANEELLGNDEALLVINLTRSLLRFLDAKISTV